MRRALLAVWLLACSEDPAPAPQQPGQFGGAPPPSTEGVECNHPGAGSTIADDRCECTSPLSISGEWGTKWTCREGTACPLGDGDATIRFTQTGSDVIGEIGTTFKLTGKLCGEFLIWTGGPSDGSSKECGQIRFTDATHFVRDSCYGANSCTNNFGRGCPSDKGQCTGTGAKKPATAAPIQKNICN